MWFHKAIHVIHVTNADGKKGMNIFYFTVIYN